MARSAHNSKPTKVIYVRHGRTPTTGKVLPGRAKGLHLSEEGKLQAKDTATRIAEAFDDIAAIYASPLERTRETAAPIAEALGLAVQTSKGLIECDVGDWTGAELKQVAKLPEWRTVQINPSGFRFPGGESLLEMQSRICSTVLDLCRAHSGETIVVVSHADPIKAALVSALGMPLDLFQRLNVSTCSISVVLYGSVPSVLTLNATPLRGLKPS